MRPPHEYRRGRCHDWPCYTAVARLLKCPLSRSDGSCQGRRLRASAAREPWTAGRCGGYPLLIQVLTQPAALARFDGGNSSLRFGVTDELMYQARA
jgi:hypothetical protein